MEVSIDGVLPELNSCSSGIIGPRGLLKTVPHVATASAALGGIVCFSVALVFQRPFDATLAALLTLLCQHVLSLQNERLKLEICLKLASKAGSYQLPGHPVQELGHSTTVRQVEGSHAVAPSEDMDLTSYAQALGLEVARGGSPDSGSALSQILLNSLAKEYLRCVSALQSYKAVFGSLEALACHEGGGISPGRGRDGFAVADMAPPLAGGVGLEASARFAPPAQASQQLGYAYGEPLQPSQRRPSAPMALDLQADELNVTTVLTPRSPKGPPSPEQQQRRRSREAFAAAQSPGNTQASADLQRFAYAASGSSYSAVGAPAVQGQPQYEVPSAGIQLQFSEANAPADYQVATSCRSRSVQ